MAGVQICTHSRMHALCTVDMLVRSQSAMRMNRLLSAKLIMVNRFTSLLEIPGTVSSLKAKLVTANVELRCPCRREAKAESKAKKREAELEASLALYEPKQDPNAQGDPMKTLFVCRLDHGTTEPELKAEFGRHGPIRSIKMVQDREGKSRGYAFVEFEHTADMKTAYKAYPPDGHVQVRVSC